jgi:hypothetical protein
VRGKAEGGQPQRRVVGACAATSRYTQRPVGSASAVWTCGTLSKQHAVEDLGAHHPVGRASWIDTLPVARSGQVLVAQ